MWHYRNNSSEHTDVPRGRAVEPFVLKRDDSSSKSLGLNHYRRHC